MTSDVQSVVFKSQYWTVTRAWTWLKKHGFKHNGKVDIKAHTLRFRQTNPRNYKRYTIKKVKPTVQLVIGFKK